MALPIGVIVRSCEFLSHNQTLPLLALLSSETRKKSAIQRQKWALKHRAKKYHELAKELQEWVEVLRTEVLSPLDLLVAIGDIILQKFQFPGFNADYPLKNGFDRPRRPKLLINRYVPHSRSLSPNPVIVHEPVTIDAVYRTRGEKTTRCIRQRPNVAALVY